MYWLLDKGSQQKVRDDIDGLVNSLSTIKSKVAHSDQIFPFQGRKLITQAKTTIEILSNNEAVVVDPFMGSGSFAYAASFLRRKVSANEFEPYTFLMASAPYRFGLYGYSTAYKSFLTKARQLIEHYYHTTCTCGNVIAMDSLFFDREPLEFFDVTPHERLGPKGKNIVYRGKYKCQKCEKTEKFFDKGDLKRMKSIERLPEPDIFDTELIENSRINLSGDFVHYANLFSKRSKLVMNELWGLVSEMDFDEPEAEFIRQTLLSIMPQAKYKDYRSKSQDLHCPPLQLREVNLLNRFEKQAKKRLRTLEKYALGNSSATLKCMDYRDFLGSFDGNSIDLIITDPPWNDGNAYFEKSQLYHPWINFDLKKDRDRLAKEVVVSDSPSRPDKQGSDQWWADISRFFELSYHTLKPHRYLVLFFRPVPASRWIENLNKIKLLARINGFEPLLAIDTHSNDPSMRIQQSVHYAFSSDIVMVFLRLADMERRSYEDEIDLDELGFRAAVDEQESRYEPFTRQRWNSRFANICKDMNVPGIRSPKRRNQANLIFERTCEKVSPGLYLPRPDTPYSDEIFGTPYIERVSLYVPYVIEDLLANQDRFSFDQFLLKLAEFVENGTRSIIGEITGDSENSIKSLLEIYAEPIESGKYFVPRETPNIPSHITSILDLDPYEFERFCAKLLQAEGYSSVVVAGRSGDRGVDIRCTDKRGNLVVVQCKRYTKSNVSATPLQRLHSFAVTRGAERMICITTTGYTTDAIDEAKKIGVELIDRERLNELVDHHKFFTSTS